ncbi:MAG: antibiotic biosynthesis monooxygenase [Methanoregula sp.]|nr:antibiotic biosynthesis monooxygenase [Methanoregula sp.]
MIELAPVFPRSNVVVTARYPIGPESANRMQVITHDLTTASRAEEGCVLYHVAESMEKEGVFSLFMIRQDEASYERYAGSDYVRAFNSILSGGMISGSPVIEKGRPLG